MTGPGLTPGPTPGPTPGVTHVPRTIAELRQAYADRITSPSDVVAATDAAIDAYGDPALFCARVPLDVAVRAADAGAGTDTPLAGVPFVVKANIDVAGLASTAGCPERTTPATADAAVVAALTAAGAIPIASANMDQFATGLVGTRSPFGTPRNPVVPGRIPGGSSSGSAMAVAAGLVPFALGTDTAGSGRVPAAFGAIVGLKPSIGRLPTAGVLPAVATADCVSVFAATVADAWDVLVTAAPAAAGAPDTVPGAVAGLRIGVPRPSQREFAEADAATAFEDALAVLDAIGAELVAVDIAPFLAAGELLYGSGWRAQRAAAVGAEVVRHDRTLDPVVAAIVRDAARTSGVEVWEGLARLAELRQVTDAVWESVDLLCLPTVPAHPTPAQIAADPFGANAALGRYTTFVNLLDCCAIAVPGPMRRDGLPAGVSLIGPHGADALVATVGAAVHAAAGVRLAWGGPVPEPGRLRATTTAPAGMIPLAVVGAHLRGLPLHHQLLDRHARFVRTTRTARSYRLYELAGTKPPKPGLVRVADGEAGAEIEVEVWALDAAAFGSFVAGVPSPLCIGTVALADGEVVHGFLCEAAGLGGATDITASGGWRAYLASAGVS